MPMNFKIMLTLALYLFLGTAFVAHAGKVPDAVQKAIDEKFPEATINEIEQEMWKGQPVTEVELTSKDGVDYEVLVSDNGKIVSMEEETELPWIGGELSIGLGIFAEQDIYKGTDTEYEAAPGIIYENGPLEIQAFDGIGASFKAYSYDPFYIAVSGSISFEEGYDPDDSDYLKGMEELDTLYGAGLELGAVWGNWEAGLGIEWDLSGEHDGRQVELSLGYSKAVAGFVLRPELSLTWLSEKTVDYFYGVSAAEARADRPAYSPGSSYEIGAELLIQRPLFSDNFSIVGLIGISTFGNEITDSPLVDEDYEIGALIGVMYDF